MTKILIVEDNPTISQLYRSKLEAHDYIVAIATDGVEAITMTTEFRPSLILLDIMMPEMNGDIYLERIRKTKDFAETPVIVLTNMNSEESLEKFEALNVRAYLLKSELTPKQVLEHVKRHAKTSAKKGAEKKQDDGKVKK